MRIACAALEADVGVPLSTASAVTPALPSRTPLTRPDAETVARVVSEEDHWKVTPVETGVLPENA
ncbi:MAG TPA: hypothetical protein VEZ49_01005, partial [Gemmatimonadales bacterium]|nr:hypothetical protein [Gemmatimonadales bacterium]